MSPEDSNDVGWATRLLRDVLGMTGEDLEARRLSIVLTYFESVRNDERHLRRQQLAKLLSSR